MKLANQLLELANLIFMTNNIMNKAELITDICIDCSIAEAFQG